MAEVTEPIVFDFGSHSTKFGFAGDDSPRGDSRSVMIGGGGYGETCFGDEALKKRKEGSLKNLVERGRVTDWKDMEEFIKHCLYQELRIGESDSILPMVTIAPSREDIDTNREKFGELFMETFNARGYHFTPLPGTFSLYSSGRTTGVVLDIGEGCASSTPIWEGYSIHRDAVQIDVSHHLSGGSVTDYLQRLVSEKGGGYNNLVDREDFREMKEKLCYTANWRKEGEEEQPKEFVLPDGETTITIGRERFAAPEILFKPPPSWGQEEEETNSSVGILLRSIEFDAHSPEVRRDLLSNIVLSGGCTLLPNFEGRLQEQMQHCLLEKKKSGARVKVVAPSERKYSVWIGGSILGSLSVFNDSVFVTKGEYQEEGSDAARRKFSFFKA